MFANKKTEFLTVTDYANHIFNNHKEQKWLNPPVIKNNLVQIKEHSAPLHIHLMSIELNTCFRHDDEEDMSIIVKLYLM